MRITTWNLQGRERPDVASVAAVVRELGADVVLLQEVQRRQAHRLADELGCAVAWRWKHWPGVVPPEGLAVLASEVRDVRRVVVARRWRFWSSHRRTAVAATVPGDARVVTVHLGAGVGDGERARQARIVGGIGADVVAGDLNTRPGSPVLEVLAGAGLRDAWDDVRAGDDGPTNWPGPRTRPPSQRLDYVMVGDRWRVVAADVPDARVAVERFGALSDHLPVTVTLEDRR